MAERGADANLHQRFAQFLQGFVYYGPGVFVVGFGPVLGQTEFLFSVFDRVTQALRGFEGSIPLAYLEQDVDRSLEKHVNAPVAHRTANGDTGPLLRALRQVWGLFSERGPDAPDRGP